MLFCYNHESFKEKPSEWEMNLYSLLICTVYTEPVPGSRVVVPQAQRTFVTASKPKKDPHAFIVLSSVRKLFRKLELHVHRA